jgi:hypothetical protein
MSERGSDEPEKKRRGDRKAEGSAGETSVDTTTTADEWDDDDSFGPRRRGLPIWVIALGVVLALLATAALARIAGEEHYQSCVAAVSAHYGTASDPLTRLARIKTIDNCSRSPF